MKFSFIFTNFVISFTKFDVFQKVDEVDKYLGENSDEINEIVKAEQAGSEQFGKICELERAKAERMKIDRVRKLVDWKLYLLSVFSYFSLKGAPANATDI